MKPKQLLQRFDAAQRGRRALAFPIAVGKKFGEDQGGYLAALVAYYGFFSLFPLLLALVTVMGFVIGNNPELQEKVLGSALAQFPIIGDQIRGDVHSIRGSGLALVVGIAGALWGGMGVVQALQNAMNRVWDVAAHERPKFLKARLRALAMLAVLGAATVVAAALSGIGAASGTLALPVKLLALVGSLAVNFGVFLLAFRVLTVERVTWRDVLPGALCAAVAWAVLQSLGNWIVGNQLRDAGQTYGFFAVVIGLLTWLFIGAQMTILAAEINVVRARRLWPRGLVPPLTEADERALEALARVEERLPEETIDVRLDDGVTAGEPAVSPEPAPTQAAPAAAAPAWQDDGRLAGGRGGGADGAGDVPATELLRRVLQETKTFVQQDLALARAEMAGKFREAGKGAGALGASAVVGVLCALALTSALVLGLATVLPGWAAALAGAVLLGLAGTALAVRGRRAVREATPVAPERALETLAATKDAVADAWRAGQAGPAERVIELPEARPTRPEERRPPRW